MGMLRQAYPRGGKDCVADRRREANQAGFSRACRGQVLAVEEYDFDLRSVTETGKAVLCEVGVQYAAIGKENPLEECAANP